MAAKHRGPGQGSVYAVRDATGRVAHWEAKVTLPDGRRRKRRAPTRAEAGRRLDALRREAERDRPDLARLDVADYLAYWMEATAAGRDRSTQGRHLTAIRLHLAPGLGRHRLDRLAPAAIAQLQRELLATKAPGTVASILATLNAALADAVRWELLDRNPMASLRLPPPSRATVRPMEADEARAILAAVAGWRYEAAIVVALGLGLRQGEVRALRWLDLDLDGGWLRVNGAIRHTPRALRHEGEGVWRRGPPKTARSARTLPLPAFVADALRAHRTRLGAAAPAEAAVFLTRAGNIVDQSELTNGLGRRLRAAGLPHRRFHDLRHGATSLLLTMGAPVPVVMAILGHTSPAMTLSVYAHMPDPAIAAAMAGMDGTLRDADRAS